MSENMEAFRIDQFAMGGMGAPMAPAPAAPAAGGAGAKKGKDAGYPTLEGILADKKKLDAFAATADATVKKLEEKASKGASPQEKADGRKALTAYEHMQALLHEGVEAVTKEQKRREAKLKAMAQGKK
jgi:hypothetical protein